MVRELVRANFPKIHQDIIDQFYDFKLLSGAKEETVKNYLVSLKVLSKFYPDRRLEELTPEEIERFVLSTRPPRYSYNTHNKIKVHVKNFYVKFVGDRLKLRDWRSELRTLKIGRFKKVVTRADFLTPDEIKRLYAELNTKYKCLVTLAFEGGLRIGECLSLRRKNVEPAWFGFLINVPSPKMGVEETKSHERSVPIIHMASYIANHLEQLPDDPETPLFDVGYFGARTYLKRKARKAGINKRVFWHLFRHQRATDLTPKLPEAILKRVFGWKHDSQMPSRYTSLTAEEVVHGVLRAEGVNVEKTPKEQFFTLHVCKRCSHKNPPTRNFCEKCNFPLTEQAELIILQQKEEKETIIKRLERLEKLIQNILQSEK